MAANTSAADSPAGRDVRRMVAELIPYLRIAHQVGGRVRLKLADEAWRAPVLRDGAGERMREILGALPGVRGITFNALARSCVVEYDNSVIPDVAWPDLLGGRSTTAAQTLLDLLAAVARDASFPSPFPPVTAPCRRRESPARAG